MSSHTFLPVPEFEKLSSSITQRLDERADRLNPAAFIDFVDPSIFSLFRDVLQQLGATEGAVWIADTTTETLVPVFNQGSNPEKFLKEIRQPLSKGIISVVFHTQIGCCELDVYKNAAHDPTVDRKSGSVTTSMVAVPFFYANEVRGIVSAVKLKPAGATEAEDPPPFDPVSLSRLNGFASVFGSNIDHQIIKSLFGLR